MLGLAAVAAAHLAAVPVAHFEMELQLQARPARTLAGRINQGKRVQYP